MAESLTKAKLVAEIAAAGKLTKADVGRVLERLTDIAYREAPNGFVIPGVCKLKVVTKKACRRRNPITGQTFLIGERQALKIVPLKKARTAVTPNTNVVIQQIETVSAPPAQAVATPEAAPAAPPPAADVPVPPPANKIPAVEEGHIVFSCAECGSMLAAPPTSAGQQGECPFCKARTQIPERKPEPAAGKAIVNTAGPPSSDFILFVCRACGQEIEAPSDMVGMNVECPTCGTGLTVPIAEASKKTSSTLPGAAKDSGAPSKNRSSMTIRIDLSDLE